MISDVRVVWDLCIYLCKLNLVISTICTRMCILLPCIPGNIFPEFILLCCKIGHDHFTSNFIPLFCCSLEFSKSCNMSFTTGDGVLNGWSSVGLELFLKVSFIRGKGVWLLLKLVLSSFQDGFWLGINFSKSNLSEALDLDFKAHNGVLIKQVVRRFFFLFIKAFVGGSQWFWIASQIRKSILGWLNSLS